MKIHYAFMSRLFITAASLMSVFIFSSCAETNSFRAGGGAFDDSELGRKLDANSHLPDPEVPVDRSFEQWRNQD